MRFKSSQLLPVLGAFLVGLFGGGGAYWKWKELRNEDVHVSIEAAKASLEIRSKMDELLSQIVAYLLDSNLREKHLLEFRAKVDDYNAAERQLAKIEGRDPVTFKFQIPAAPRGVRIE